ncbi:hypothetical protein GP486_003953 [Trichoglossum hirsutum]|uniref:Uncharacterized protein n=1 Tax=Trichoglossum hirsutum TaxID=265104 RepID=A0A9P8LBZ1_9PEZI|nr:hypothetical protein GP486_003953 [Trichoglossum hirsutum]
MFDDHTSEVQEERVERETGREDLETPRARKGFRDCVARVERKKLERKKLERESPRGFQELEEGPGIVWRQRTYKSPGVRVGLRDCLAKEAEETPEAQGGLRSRGESGEGGREERGGNWKSSTKYRTGVNSAEWLHDRRLRLKRDLAGDLADDLAHARRKQ